MVALCASKLVLEVLLIETKFQTKKGETAMIMIGMRTRIYLPCRGLGTTTGNKLEAMLGGVEQEGNWIEVEAEKPGVFVVVNDNMTVGDGNWVTENTALGFSWWDDEVENLDAGFSEVSQCFPGMSCYLKWQNVYLTTSDFRAPSVERLKEALNHVAICAWCPGDI